jgi:hypothetical protein
LEALTSAKSTATGVPPPSGTTCRSCSTRSSRVCSGQRHVADLVQEQGAAVRLAQQARLSFRAARP